MSLQNIERFVEGVITEPIDDQWHLIILLMQNPGAPG
jgi:hypothetical protein